MATSGPPPPHRVEVGALVVTVAALALDAVTRHYGPVIVVVTASASVLALQVWRAASPAHTPPPVLTVLWVLASSGAALVASAIGGWPDSDEGDVLAWAMATAVILVLALLVHKAPVAIALIERSARFARVAGLALPLVVAGCLVAAGLTIVLNLSGRETLGIGRTMGWVAAPSDPATGDAARGGGWRDCVGEIGDVADEQDAQARTAAEAFVALTAALVEWELCSIGPVVRVRPGQYAQAVGSAVAGSLGWLLIRYDGEGSPEVQFIEPQVGQVYVEQISSGWRSGPPPWAAAWGSPGLKVACGDGALQVFWKDGRVSGYALWSYDPSGPDDKDEVMEAWFVPAAVARALVDLLASTGGTLPQAFGPPDPQDGYQEFRDVGVVQPADDPFVLASEITARCG